jgi:hypothetical protein
MNLLERAAGNPWDILERFLERDVLGLWIDKVENGHVLLRNRHSPLEQSRHEAGHADEGEDQDGKNDAN